MAFVAIDKDGGEYIFHNEPNRTKNQYWIDTIYYDEYRCHTTQADDGSIELPEGTIKKLIGKELTWNDKPVKLE